MTMESSIGVDHGSRSELVVDRKRGGTGIRTQEAEGHLLSRQAQ